MSIIIVQNTRRWLVKSSSTNHEPLEARQPKTRWRFYQFMGDELVSKSATPDSTTASCSLPPSLPLSLSLPPSLPPPSLSVSLPLPLSLPPSLSPPLSGHDQVWFQQ